MQVCTLVACLGDYASCIFGRSNYVPLAIKSLLLNFVCVLHKPLSLGLCPYVWPGVCKSHTCLSILYRNITWYTKHVMWQDISWADLTFTCLQLVNMCLCNTVWESSHEISWVIYEPKKCYSEYIYVTGSKKTRNFQKKSQLKKRQKYWLMSEFIICFFTYYQV